MSKYWNKNLLFAAEIGNLDSLKESINNGADINTTDKHNRTAIMIAITSDNIDVFKELIDEKAELNLEDSAGNTVLILASHWALCGKKKYINALPIDHINTNIDTKYKEAYGEVIDKAVYRSQQKQLEQQRLRYQKQTRFRQYTRKL